MRLCVHRMLLVIIVVASCVYVFVAEEIVLLVLFELGGDVGAWTERVRLFSFKTLTV